MKKTAIVFLIVAMFAITGNVNAQITFDEASQKQMVMTNMSSMHLTFTENRGQWNEKALFKADAGGATFWFCSDEIAYVFTRNTDELLEDDQLMRRQEPLPDASRFDRPRYKKESLVIRAQLIGANLDAEVIGENRLSHNCNYFYGNEPIKWRTDVPNYSTITYKDIYPGIDLKYHGNGLGMKYDFIVNPGADMSQIQIRYEGADNLAITPNGDLEASTLFGPIHENIPSVYQKIGNDKREVTGRYIIRTPGVFGFEVEDYNPSLTLVIDPVLVYSTYLGGNDISENPDIAIDGSGFAYVTGQTHSTDFPTLNPYQTDQGGIDVFVTKFSLDGNTLVYSTYLGGDDDDFSHGIAVDGNGNAYAIGYTYSTDFPTLNPYQTVQGGIDVFVAKFSLDGNSLVYSTYLGGTDNDLSRGIAIDGSANAYVTGYTTSTDFPTLNPYQSNPSGLRDVFVTKFSSDGDALVYSTYLGGTDNDYGYDIALDGSGSAYVTGTTYSTDFPTLNPYQTDQGTRDVFVTKFSFGGDSLVYSTYLGGTDWDYGRGIAVDSSGSAYVTGETSSPNFPTLNPYQTHQGIWDAFVTKLSPGGNSLVYGTYLGGNDDDFSHSIALDGNGNAYVTGRTISTDFPTENPYQADQGYWDAFVTKLSSSGDSLLYSTYLGGSMFDGGNGIAIDGSGNAYVTGETQSTDFPTLNPYQAFFHNYLDMFVTKLGEEPETGTIAGTVTETDGTTPIEGVTVTAEGTTIDDTTDSSGQYFLEFPEADIYNITFSCTGYFDTTATGIIVNPNDTTILDLSMQKNDPPQFITPSEPLIEICTYEDYCLQLDINEPDSEYVSVTLIGVGSLDTTTSVAGQWTGQYCIDAESLCGASVLHEIFIIASDGIFSDTVQINIEFLGKMILSFEDSLVMEPLEEKWIPVYLNTYYDCFCIGSFELLIAYDYTILEVVDAVIYLEGDMVDIYYDNYSGYIHMFFLLNLPGPDPDTLCALNPNEPIGNILFRLADYEYPPGYSIPLVFSEPDSGFYNNMISDASAYTYWQNSDCYNPYDTVTVGVMSLELAHGSIAIDQEYYEYLPGDVNMANGIWPPMVIGGDVTYLVNYFKGVGDACLLDGFWCSADANGDCIVMGSDVVRMVAYFRGAGDIEFCADFPPAWHTTGDLPAEAPTGWPNCETPPVMSKVVPTGSGK